MHSVCEVSIEYCRINYSYLLLMSDYVNGICFDLLSVTVTSQLTRKHYAQLFK